VDRFQKANFSLHLKGIFASISRAYGMGLALSADTFFDRRSFAFPHSARLVWHMKDDQHRFVSLCGQMPARLTTEQAGWVLNCQPHDIPVLISSRLLMPLGNPAPNGTKYFATADLLKAAKDRSWLIKMTAINSHRQKQNDRKKPRPGNAFSNGNEVLEKSYATR
jgi:hypothetical protein